jgi:hypothetical protein
MRGRILAVGVIVSATFGGPLVAAAFGVGFISPGVVPLQSIGGVRIHEYAKSVRAQVKAPATVQGNQGHLSQLIYGAKPRTLIVTFDYHRRHSPVSFIQASGAGFRTRKGVGIGSSRAAVHHAYPGMKCSARYCTSRRGSVFFDFALVHGKVVEFDLGDTKLSQP